MNGARHRLRAGVACVPLEPPLGGPMMGYGARVGGAAGVRDPLSARALYLSEQCECIWIELDVCLLAPSHADGIRTRVAERTGVPARRVLVACTHTHSGPDTGLFAALARTPTPPPTARLLDLAVEAAARARAAAMPARLGVGCAAAHIGRNRRLAAGPVDPEVLVIRLDRADGTPLAIVYVHGCHPTVLGHENLRYSADWPGAASRTIEAALPGAVGFFALGAHGDIDPRTRGLQDLAIANQSRGASDDELEALGREVGDAVAGVAAAIVTEPDALVRCDATSLVVPVHGAEAGAEARATALAADRLRALAALGLDPALDFPVGEWFRRIGEHTAALSADEARPRIAAVRAYLRNRTAPRFAGGLAPSVSLQVLRLGPAALLALPAEATVDVGLDWKQRLDASPGAVLSIANGWLRYLPHAKNYAEPDAGRHYEILMSTFVPDAATRLLVAGEALWASMRH
jgi:hypothetical protein